MSTPGVFILILHIPDKFFNHLNTICKLLYENAHHRQVVVLPVQLPSWIGARGRHKRPIPFVFYRADQNPTHFAGLSAAMQTWLKFGRGLHRCGLTAVSVRVLLLPHGVPHFIDRGCFVSCADSVGCTGKGYAAASTSMPPSMASFH
jgi:hypothetical protein